MIQRIIKEKESKFIEKSKLKYDQPVVPLTDTQIHLQSFKFVNENRGFKLKANNVYFRPG